MNPGAQRYHDPPVALNREALDQISASCRFRKVSDALDIIDVPLIIERTPEFVREFGIENVIE